MRTYIRRKGPALKKQRFMVGVMVVGVTLSFGVLAGAEETTTNTEQEQVETLPEVTVKGKAEDTGYAPRNATTATKTDTPLLETPQSITVVPKERIEDQGATSLQDALNYAAGVRSDAYGLDSRTDSVFVRGGYPDEYLDGLHQKLGGFYTSTFRMDPYLLERIEVLRGPSAMLFGQGTTGGVINMVSKRPLATAEREIGLQYGSFNRKQIQTDLTGAVTSDGEWLYRVIALGRKSDTQVDYVTDDRYLVAPSLTWRPSAATDLTLQLLWQQDRSGSTSQFFPWEGVILPNPNGQIPVNRFIGEPEFDRYDSDRLAAGWLFEHRLNDQWTVRQNLRLARNEVDYKTLYSDSFSDPSNPYIDAARRQLNRFDYLDEREVQLLTADQHVEARLETGLVRHQVLVGFDYAQHDESARVGFGGTIPAIDVFAPVYGGYLPPALSDSPETTLQQVGLYLQDQMKINERWIVVAGLRHDRANNEQEGGDDEKDNATTKRLGLMYLFAGGWAPFLSYSESFSPVGGADLFGVRFKPLRGEQIEAGVKWQAPDQDVIFTAAVYDLKEKNRLVTDPNNALNSVQTGETENQGVELELVGRVLPPLEIAAHYNYIDIDEQLEILPAHQAAVWGTYEFALAGLRGFECGLGVRYMNSFKDGAAPEVPANTLVDAMLGYESDSWRYALNVQNLTDEIYTSTCLSRGDCFYGVRRTIVASAAYKF